MTTQNSNISGLSESEVIQSRTTSGRNSLEHQEQNHLLHSIIDMVKEPMFLLLVAATAIYFITGEYGNGIFMAVAIAIVSAISLFQESRSRNAIDTLKKLSQPTCTPRDSGIATWTR